jgi:RNA polymerase sigma-70 factor (ECF subfamily)
MSEVAPRSDVVLFETIFRTYYDALVALAIWYVGSTESAEEIVDDVFLALWEQRERWVVRDSVRAYLFGATRNRALNAVRDRRTRGRLLRQARSEVVARPLPEADAVIRTRDLDSAIDRALAELPPRALTVLTLHRQAGLSFAEIADLLGISSRTVETHLARAVRALRRRLGSFLSVMTLI